MAGAVDKRIRGKLEKAGWRVVRSDDDVMFKSLLATVKKCIFRLGCRRQSHFLAAL